MVHPTSPAVNGGGENQKYSIWNARGDQEDNTTYIMIHIVFTLDC